MNIQEMGKKKVAGQKISMVTCYDYWSARIIDESDIDCVLVGDSAAMVMHGHPSTIPADLPMMAIHTQAVARGLTKKFLIGDMPFLSYRKGRRVALDAVEALMKAGAASVKLEGVWGHEDVIEDIVRSGVPVIGHIGLTPQSLHQIGGFKVQGREDAAAEDLKAQAKALEDLGAGMVVLECVPSKLAADITRSLTIPTIGIGAGPETDGQVLVLQDLLGFNGGFSPKFLRTFLDGRVLIRDALQGFHEEVVGRSFPSEKESYR